MGSMTAQQIARQRLANLGLDAFAPKPSTDKRLRENRANVRNASSRMWKWRQRWLELAEQFKETKL